MGEYIWNPWHGCKKYSEGCKNCYVYRRDGSVGRDAGTVTKNADFDLPLRKNRRGEYKVERGSTVWCCMTSDFFLAEADIWRNDIWSIIRERSDVDFVIITKRITRFYDCIPDDWGDGWDNVTLCCTCENRKRATERLPVFSAAPIKHKIIICEPLLERINISPYLDCIEAVVAGGESGTDVRECDFDWILDLRDQCVASEVAFRFKQTGANFIKNGKRYRVPRRLQHTQARAANVNYEPE